MGFYEARVVPRLVDLCCGASGLRKVRARVCAPLSGEVLEVGFGSGRNVAHYPAAVTRVLAVEPSARAREMAAPRVAASRVQVDYVGLDGQDLPLDDASVDNVLCTWSLCTIPDPARALREMRRVLRPGGALQFVEHGLSSDPRVARWQHRLTPLQRRLAGGCHLDRPIVALIDSAGFSVAACRAYLAAWPKSYGQFYEGRAEPRQ